MPYIGGLHVILAIYFAIHAIRNHRELYWVVILFMFPFLGSVVYLFAVYLPEAKHSRVAHKAKRVVKQAIDPGRTLREAEKAFSLTPTVQNRLAFAQALLDAQRFDEALQHFDAAASGPFSNDAIALVGLAKTSLLTGKPGNALQALDRLFAAHPTASKQAEPSLLKAQAMASLGHEGTDSAFQAAIAAAGDQEARCSYADWLMQSGATAQAKDQYQLIVQDSAHWHKHAKAVNSEWLKRAKQALNS